MAAPIKLTIFPAATGRQLVRISIPLPIGFLVHGQTLVARHGELAIATATRILTWHGKSEPASARRALVTWITDFKETEPVPFSLQSCNLHEAPRLPPRLPVDWQIENSEITIDWEGGAVVKGRLLAPGTNHDGDRVEREIVESHGLFHWERIIHKNHDFSRVLELRADGLGQLSLIAHVQRNLPGNDYAPDLGWEFKLRFQDSRLTPVEDRPVTAGSPVHQFDQADDCAFYFERPSMVIYHPAAPYRMRGSVAIIREADPESMVYRYLRCSDGDRTPWQSSAWLRFETVLAPKSLARLTPAMTYPHAFAVEPQLWHTLYQTRKPPQLPAKLELARTRHRDLLLKCVARGDDWGNVIAYDANTRQVGNYPMNRLNHCPPIFFAGWLGNDPKLVETALLWCDNFHDLTIWWGPGLTGGTRYNYGPAVDHHPPPGDPGRFTWRSNRTVDFCTKGYDSFFLAWEETGDPRMRQALLAQVAVAEAEIRVDQGECRNIGDVRDLIRLYRYSGEEHYLEHALRLFRELKSKLWANHLFDQNGKPESTELSFIDNDQDGYRQGYAKPYIIGYALAGLPELLQECPDEPRLRQVVQAVVDFLTTTQDPAGGWRYPHPKSSGLGLGSLEQAWLILQAMQSLGTSHAQLDAIEKTLQARIQGILQKNCILTGLAGWEKSTGQLKPNQSLGELYDRPEDRDPSRDYDQGKISTDTFSPESLVYFNDLLTGYLADRPAEKLLAPIATETPLARILRRLPDPDSFQTEGVRDLLPVFHDQILNRLKWPLSRAANPTLAFADWRRRARDRVIESLLQPPAPRAFNPMVLAELDRDSYQVRKIAFNLNADSRVAAYLLVPRGHGPFPAVLLLHDHGACFELGKEKVVMPFDLDKTKQKAAGNWVEQCYGGRFIGDELARRGYLCLATDMLNWSDRGGGGYQGQQGLAANLLQMGMSFAGLIAHEDMAAAEFLASQPEVDKTRVATIGLSVGAYRSWQLAALSPHVRAGIAICWMATIAGQMQPGINQTRGQSSFSMIHPGLANSLDFPDIASIACPKPMLFYNGLEDHLFDPDDVRTAYARMSQVWREQGVSERLETRLWREPHIFSREMQDTAFTWLNHWL